MVKLASLVAGTVLAAFISAPAMAATELVINGGFEEAPNPASGTFLQYFGGQSFSGWTVTGNDILLIDKAYTEDTLVFNANPASNVAADLTGAGNTGPNDGVMQTLNTVAGQNYNLVFFVGNADTTGSFRPFYLLPSTIDLAINGVSRDGFTNAAVTENSTNFREFHTIFTGTGHDTLLFTNGTVGDNYAGLDDVSVTAVPEPASWGLMILGFGGLGAALRRRRTLAGPATA